MIFVLGLIIGLLLAYGVVALGFVLHYREPMRAIEQLEKTFRPKGSIILPKSEVEKRQEQIMEDNDAAGRDTKLSELL